MNDNASMLNMNSSPNMIDRIPIMILLAVNPANTNAIPKNNKLIPIIMDTTPELKIGKIIKINPKIMDNIPDILFASMFFPPILLYSPFPVKNIKIQKSSMLFYVINFFL